MTENRAMVHGFIEHPRHEYGLLRAGGADAAGFLQSQLTNDVETLLPGELRLAGFCNAKGRLQASFWIWREADAFFLELAPDLAERTVRRLKMFVLRAKCLIEDVSALYAKFEFAGAAPPGSLNLPPPAATSRAVRFVKVEEVAAYRQWLGDLPELQTGVFKRLQIQSGIAQVTAATFEQFVPQMLNYESAGGVSFKKGCYPGQEVVARSQFRGTAKRRTFIGRADGAMAPGAEVFTDEDAENPAGMVVNCAGDEAGGFDVLVELKLSEADKPLHAQGVALRALPLTALPYKLLEDV